MKKVLLFFFALLFFNSTYSQKDIGVIASAAVQIPLGDLSSTHSFGISLDVAPGYHTYKLINRERSKTANWGRMAFTYNGGLTYYFGKNEMVSGYPYKYPGYLFIHGFGGLFINPAKKITASLLAGPALGIYNGNTRFNIGGRLEGNYRIKNMFSAGPMINCMWEPGTRSLWSAGIKLSLDL
jgi:hypothetical protein